MTTEAMQEQLYGSEFRHMIECFRRLHVPHSMHWDPGNYGPQKDVITKYVREKLNHTSHSLSGVIIGDQQFIFANTEGRFLFVINEKTGELSAREQTMTLNEEGLGWIMGTRKQY